MIVEITITLAAFVAGMVLGAALVRREIEVNRRNGMAQPVTSTVAITTCHTHGHVTFKGAITATDFLDAMNRLHGPDRKLVLANHSGPSHMLHALFLLFSHLPQKEKA